MKTVLAGSCQESEVRGRTEAGAGGGEKEVVDSKHQLRRY